MHAAGDAGVEGVDHPQDFQRVGRVGHGNAHQGLLQRARDIPGTTGAEVSGGRHDHLVTTDGVVLDVDPVAQGAAWCLCEAHPRPR